MSTYAIGDIQGCFDTLIKLLEHLSFNEKSDKLWLTGDIVNRGPKSLESLRFAKNLNDKCQIILGNHDLHLLAVAHKAHKGWDEDTFSDILNANDKIELINWLSNQPLIHHDQDYTMVHAGLASSWDLTKSKKLAAEVETILQSDNAYNFFKTMYADHPNQWDDNLEGFDRLRCITNFFTRSRFCYTDGSLELKNKGNIKKTQKLIPWFNVQNRKSLNMNIIFGHWAALGGITNTPKTYALDTGCVWGYKLTAMRLEDKKLFSVKVS
ncbi:symmetrical bis(5'-nucleosyl)-tetraphosphatase [Gammaproteobacteria bacterium]|nr:symmetrical bis(5'-nucleosyl)-tetraphosphatase [Gammaproteobacteria bacterium]